MAYNACVLRDDAVLAISTFAIEQFEKTAEDLQVPVKVEIERHSTLAPLVLRQNQDLLNVPSRLLGGWGTQGAWGLYEGALYFPHLSSLAKMRAHWLAVTTLMSLVSSRQSSCNPGNDQDGQRNETL
jgi:hypothetical protein